MAAKVFEVGDVLPATTQLRITGGVSSYFMDRTIFSTTSNGIVFTSETPDESWFYIRIKVNGIQVYYQYFSDSEPNFSTTIDTSSLSESQRTVNEIYEYPTFDLYWEILVSGYNVTYEENGGTSVTDLTEQTNLPNPLPTPTKSNLAFGGWFYESNFTTKALANDTLISDVTLYAKWLDTSALLLKLNAIRNALKTSINAKGGTLTTETLDQYASAVDGIQVAIELTQAQYDALATKDANTYYLING